MKSTMRSSSTSTTTPFIELDKYSRHWKVVTGLWGLFAMTTAVLQCLVLVHPSWIASADGNVHFGLYDMCEGDCDFTPWRIQPISSAFEVSAIAVLASTLLSLLAVFTILVLGLLGDSHAFVVSSWLHLFSCICQVVGVAVFPFAWTSSKMHALCQSDSFELGSCVLRWPVLLACVLACDHLSLSLLGCVLSCRKPPKRSRIPFQTFEYVHHLPPPAPPEFYFTNGGTMKL